MLHRFIPSLQKQKHGIVSNIIAYEENQLFLRLKRGSNWIFSTFEWGGGLFQFCFINFTCVTFQHVQYEVDQAQGCLNECDSCGSCKTEIPAMP